METLRIFYTSTKCLIILFFTFCFFGCATYTGAQEGGYSETPMIFSQEELAQMLAPIALYPDTLLTQVLMASTYPIEVVEADRWVKKNPGLTGQNLDAALLNLDWDPSVKAMCHFPLLLSLMSERISETTKLGNAFLSQEADVMNMVQELRARAHAQNRLVSDGKQRVIVNGDVIVIEPVDPNVIYVSYYDPAYVYGPWWYPTYPPYYWGPPGVHVGMGYSYWPGVFFGVSFGSWSYFDWHRHYIYVDPVRRPPYVRHDHWVASPGPWQHYPGHRRGVPYHDIPTANRYGQPPRNAPEQWNRPGDPHYNERNRMDTNRHWEERNKIEHGQQERERFERERHERDRLNQEQINRSQHERERMENERRQREQINRDSRMREQGERDRQQNERFQRERERTENERQQREQINRANQMREQGERDRQQNERFQRERVDRERMNRDQGQREHERLNLERQQREQADRNQQFREQAEQARRNQERTEVKKQKSDDDNTPNPPNDNRERSFGRGDANRQRSDDVPRGGGRFDDTNRGGGPGVIRGHGNR
jgi:hypothetical protein